MNRLLSILVMLAVSFSPAAGDTALRLFETCDGAAACLRMTLDVDGADPLDRPGDRGGLVTGTVRLDDDRTDYELTVEGRLNGGASRSYRLLFRAYAGGLVCTRFGQGTVAVAGFSPDGMPLLLTSGGELAVTKAPGLRIGCRDCLEVLDRQTKRAVATYPTPAWDLRLVGYRADSFRYNAAGEAFMRNGESCVRLAAASRFEAVGIEHCRTPPREVGHYGRPAHGLSLAPAEWLFESRETGYLMRLKAGACT